MATNTMTDWHGDNTPMQPGIDLGKLVVNLLNQAGINGNNMQNWHGEADAQAKNAQAAQANGAAIMQGVTPTLSQPMHPMAIDSATKAVKNYYDKHAQDMASSPEGIAALQSIIDAHTQNNQQTSSQAAQVTPKVAQAAQAVQPSTIQQGTVNPLQVLGGLVGGLSDYFTSPEAKIANSTVAMNRMKMAAGLPSETALPAAQANLTASEAATKTASLKAGQPQATAELTKQQTEESKQNIVQKKAEIAANIYKTQSERVIQHIQRLTERRKQIVDQMKDDLEHGPVWNRGTRLDEYKRQLNWYDNQINLASDMSSASSGEKNSSKASFAGKTSTGVGYTINK